MNEVQKNSASVPSSEDVRRERRSNRNTFLGFLAVSILEVYVLMSGYRTSDWRDWLIVGGAIFFPLFTVFSWRVWRNDWSPERSDQAAGRLFGWLFVTPFIIWALFLVVGWFATIPVWATVIIMLLFLILLVLLFR